MPPQYDYVFVPRVHVYLILYYVFIIAWVQYYSVFLSPIPQGSGVYIPSGGALSALFGALYGLLWSITESIISHITEHYPPKPRGGGGPKSTS